MSRKPIAIAFLVAVVAALLPGDAEAVVVERIVAVIGDKAILLTDLRKRARPYLVQLYARIPPGPQRAAAESRILSDMVQRMVDEELEATAGARESVRVTPEEVDKALANIARASGMPLSKLMENIQKDTGMTEAEYRLEIHRQVLEGKLLTRMVQNQRVSDKELVDMYQRVVKQERRILLFSPSWIVLQLPENAAPAVVKNRMARAQDLARRARAGEDFAALAKQHSEDSATKEAGGELGIRAPSGSPRALSGKHKVLAAELERRALDLEPGAVSEPFRFREAVVVLHIVSRQPSNYTTLQAARAEMLERVRNEKMQLVKEKWLRDLRRRTHVDVRL